MSYGITQALPITVACIIASYLICGIPFGLILGKAEGHVDIRKAGSGNIGTTNALRVAGPKVAAATLALDLLKGTFCVIAARYLISGIGFGSATAVVEPGGPGDWMLALVALACLCGHVFSPYLHFHGGKGIAVGVGVLFGWFWPLALFHLAVFIVLVALTRYVSVGSITTAALVAASVCVTFPYASIACKLIMASMGIIVVWAHRSNIKKLMHGKESKLSFSKRVKTKDDDS